MKKRNLIVLTMLLINSCTGMLWADGIDYTQDFINSTTIPLSITIYAQHKNKKDQMEYQKETVPLAVNGSYDFHYKANSTGEGLQKLEIYNPSATPLVLLKTIKLKEIDTNNSCYTSNESEISPTNLCLYVNASGQNAQNPNAYVIKAVKLNSH